MTTPHAPSTRRSLSIGGLALLVAGVALSVALYVLARDHQTEATTASGEQAEHASAYILGLSRPVQNTLDSRYADADGDMLADVPADASKRRNPETLRFSFLASSGVEAKEETWADFVGALKKATGKAVEFRKAESSAAQLRLLREGALDVTGFNTGNVPLAVMTAGYIPVAAINPPHTSMILVPKGSSILALSEIKGHTLTTVDPSSNSGFRAPIVALADIGLLPERDYYLRQSFSHDASITGIRDGTYEVAVTASDFLARAVNSGKISPTQYTVIYVSERFPSAALGYTHDLEPALAEKIREAILQFNAENTSLAPIVAPGTNHRFTPVHYKDDWALVRRIDNTLGKKYGS